jgi:hypothetical protein
MEPVRPRRRYRWLQVLAGVTAGLLACELGFRLRDGGAFPHLNVYQPDPVLGVRLRPGAHQRVRVANNRPTDVRINADGLRGGSLPPPSDKHDEVLVVGDSQVFGLGVEEDQTFAALLARKSGRPVVNGGVPTYGPAEYNKLLAELLPRRKPGVVVWTVNLANDLFEAARPNLERHAVWDGWAVRKETAPARVRDFPGRALLFRDSHLVFAWRRFWRGPPRRADAEAVLLDPILDGTPSEGSYQDIVGAGQKSKEARAEAEARAAAARKEKVAALDEARRSLRQLEVELDKVVLDVLPDDEAGVGLLRTAHADPGDIVRVSYAEGARPLHATAREIQRAAEARRRIEEALKQRRDQANLERLSRFDTLAEQVKGLAREANQVKVVRARSPLYAHLAEAQALARAHGARLVVLVLPLDVQVAPEEWKKYGGAKLLDMSDTQVLTEDVLASAAELGALALDALPALAAAEPGAFLDGDLHMTPKGHAAVAALLAGAIDRPPVQRLRPPEGGPQQRAAPPAAERSPAPTPDELKAVEWRDLDGGCRYQLVREWVRVRCKKGTMEVTEPGRGEAMALNVGEGASLLLALPEGDAMGARLVSPRGEWLLRAQWPLADESPWLAVYGPRPARRPAPTPSDQELALCDCQRALGRDCAALYGAADPGCFRRHGRDCERLVACARGDREQAPACPGGRPAAVAPPWCRGEPRD